MQAIDFIVAKKVLRKFESLSLGFMRDELTNYGQMRGRAFPLLYYTLRYVTPLLIIYIFLKNLGIL